MSGRLQVLCAALLFSTAGVVIKSTILTHWQIACLRSAVAAIVLMAAMPHARRLTPGVARVASAIAITFVLFIVANKLTTAAHAVFLQASAPVYLVLLSPWLLGERISLRDLPFLAAVGLGAVLLFLSAHDASATAPRPGLGNVIAAISGLTWALVLIGLRWLEQRDPKGSSIVAATIWGNVFAAVGCLPLALPIAGARPIDWAVIVYLGCFQLALAYILLMRGLRRLTALEASLLLLLEPALNPLWTWIVHRESPGLLGLIGGGLVLAATTARATLVREPARAHATTASRHT